MQGRDIEDFSEGNIRDVVEDFRDFVGEKSESELASFARTLLYRVELILLCVPDTAMAFQMFQTANARGTPLSQLDMFRSTVVMQAETVLNVNRNQMAQILGFLRKIEDEFIKKYADEVKRTSAVDKFMKYWIWIRRGSPSGGVSYIMKMVEDCEDLTQLFFLVCDLFYHVETWCEDVDVSFSNIPKSVSLHPMFATVTDTWKPLYLAVKAAKRHNPRRYISEAQETMLYDLLMWWYLIEDARSDKAVNKTKLRSIVVPLAHRSWHHAQMCDLEWDGWDKDSFAEEVRKTMVILNSHNSPHCHKTLSQSTHSGAKRAIPILAQFERLGREEGLGMIRIGSFTRDANLVHLIPQNVIPLHLENSIGNRTLCERPCTQWKNTNST